MKTIFIIAVAFATFALLLIAYKECKHKKFAYGVAIATPIAALLFFILIFGINISQKEPFSKSKEQVFSQLEDSAQKFAEKIKAKPDDIESVLAYAELQMHQTKYDDAIEVLNKTYAKHKSDKRLQQQLSIAYFSNALFLAEGKKDTKALENFKKAKETAPKDAPYLLHIDFFMKVVENRNKKK